MSSSATRIHESVGDQPTVLSSWAITNARTSAIMLNRYLLQSMDKDLQYETFVAAVKDMRQLQKKYFETRNPNVLTNARKAERVVDRLLDEQEQLSIF